MKGYTTATIEEYFNLTDNNSNTVFAIPAKAVEELKRARNNELVSKTLKKYLINARQAQTNARIVEALLG